MFKYQILLSLFIQQTIYLGGEQGEGRGGGEGKGEEKQKQQHYFLDGKEKNVVSYNEIINKLRLSEKQILRAGNSSSFVFKTDNLSHSRKKEWERTDLFGQWT